LNRKSELEMKMVIVIIIAIFTLAILLIYIFTTPGGPKDLIDKVLAFLDSTTNYVTATSNI